MDPAGPARVLECHDCGQRHSFVPLAPGTVAACTRCGAGLLRRPVDSLDRALALALGGLVLMVIANAMPFMSLKIQGRLQEADLVTGSIALFEQGIWPLAIVVALTTIVT